MRVMVAGVVLVMLGMGVGIGAEISAEPHRPYCPTEDSCTLELIDGIWHIEEDTP